MSFGAAVLHFKVVSQFEVKGVAETLTIKYVCFALGHHTGKRLNHNNQ